MSIPEYLCTIDETQMDREIHLMQNRKEMLGFLDHSRFKERIIILNFQN